MALGTQIPYTGNHVGSAAIPSKRRGGNGFNNGGYGGTNNMGGGQGQGGHAPIRPSYDPANPRGNPMPAPHYDGYGPGAGNRLPGPPSGQNGNGTSPSINGGQTTGGSAYDYFQGQAAPALAELDQADALGALAQQQITAQYGLDVGNLNSQLDFGMEAIGYQQQGNQIDMAAAGRQAAYYAQLMGMSTDALARRLGYINEAEMLANQSHDRQQAYIGQQHGFNATQLGLSEAEINQAYGTNMRLQLDDAAARGANTTGGNRAAVGDIKGTRIIDLGSANLQFDQQGANLDNQSADLREQLAEQLLGFRQDREELQYDYDREQLSLEEQIAQQHDREQQLAIRAQELGLSARELQQQIQYQLSSAGLSSFFGVADVIAALNSNDIQRQMIAEQIIRQATAGGQMFAGGSGVPTVSAGGARPLWG